MGPVARVGGLSATAVLPRLPLVFGDQDVRLGGFRLLAALSWLVAPAGCRVIDDPFHCANREGDASCESEFSGRSCSTCQRASSGCSEAPVEVACRPSGACEPTDAMTTAESSTGTGTGTGTGTRTGTGESSTTVVEPAECEGEGAQAACPDDRPYCVDGACSGCEPAGGHAYCEGLDAELFSDSWFRVLISDLRLNPAGVNIDELAGIGRWELGDPLEDYEGTPLPTVPGTPVYPGGDQP